jgi:hypothetical protein
VAALIGIGTSSNGVAKALCPDSGDCVRCRRSRRWINPPLCSFVSFVVDLAFRFWQFPDPRLSAFISGKLLLFRLRAMSAMTAIPDPSHPFICGKSFPTNLLSSSTSSKFGKELFQSAHREMTTATVVLLERRPNPKAIESSRMAVEMFLKTFIAAHTGLSEKEARALGHDLEAALQECVHIDRNSELQDLVGQLKMFPPISARYQALHIPAQNLWHGYAATMFCAATIFRGLTGTDIRPTIRLGSNKAPGALVADIFHSFGSFPATTHYVSRRTPLFKD